MDVIIMVAQLILGLSILVGLHEAGHMLAAKAFGMRVEKFSIGFPPKVFSKKIGETEYMLGALPLGGFVKISGMIDESLDTEAMAKEPEPWEFRAKPAWQRLIVMLGGIIVNVITGVIVFIGLTFVYGDTYISKAELNKHGIYTNEIGEELGLRNGDKIMLVNGKDFENTDDILSPENLLENGTYLTIERDGVEKRIDFPADLMDRVSGNKLEAKDESGRLISPRMPFKVGKVKDDSPAGLAGLQTGDEIVEVNGQAIRYLQEFQSLMRKYVNQDLKLTVLRDGVPTKLEATLKEDPHLGFMSVALLEESQKDYSFGESLGIGTGKAFGVLNHQLLAFKKMFKGELNPVNSMGSFVTIGKVYGGTWVWRKFWYITGMLSMVLAFMNLLPIPALDGGHVLFLSYEIISGKAPSDGFLENAQKVGMFILLGLMAFVIGLDIYNNFLR